MNESYQEQLITSIMQSAKVIASMMCEANISLNEAQFTIHGLIRQQMIQIQRFRSQKMSKS